MRQPTATYSSSSHKEYVFTVDRSKERCQSTQGTTTGPSSHVLEAGHIDKDRPSDPKLDASGQPTYLSRLRMDLTSLQDDINEFLTAQMEADKGKKARTDNAEREKRLESEIKELLDGGDGEEEG